MYDNTSANYAIVNAINDTYTDPLLTISCKKCNSAVLLDVLNNIMYLYQLAQGSPLLYVELDYKPNRLQKYIDTMNELN